MKIVFTGGGTGGHIYPLISIIREIKKIYPKDKKLSLFYVGPETSYGLDDLRQEGVKIKNITAGKIRRQKSLNAILQNIIDILFKIPLGILNSIFILKTINPDIIFSKGGFGAFPVLFANRFFRYPLFLHESDSVLGKVTQKFIKNATKVFVSFDNMNIEKAILVGNPIRKEILNGSEKEATRMFDLQKKNEFIQYCNLAISIGAFYSYMSAIIINREAWN
ncbi:glycosyltransferase, partial [Patescibacteria group bacterium]|nr:glycosyltransferase [Patescibacteria group bacterium]